MSVFKLSKCNCSRIFILHNDCSIRVFWSVVSSSLLPFSKHAIRTLNAYFLSSFASIGFIMIMTIGMSGCIGMPQQLIRINTKMPNISSDSILIWFDYQPSNSTFIEHKPNTSPEGILLVSLWAPTDQQHVGCTHQVSVVMGDERTWWYT